MALAHSLCDWTGLTLMQLHHQFTRIIYEYLLNDDHLPFPSVLSPHEAYSLPKAGVCMYVRPMTKMTGYLDIQVGNITYVLKYSWGMCL